MKNGITHTILERERMTLEAVTLPQVLKTVGYSTAILASGIWETKIPISRSNAASTRHSFTGPAASARRMIAHVPTLRKIRTSIR